MTAKYTPGPWHEENVLFNRGYSNEYLAWTVQSSKGCVAEIKYTGNYRKDCSEDESNARLIAAAPDLLAALEDSEFLMRKAGQIAGPMQDSFKRSAEDARAAIARAKGDA